MRTGKQDFILAVVGKVHKLTVDVNRRIRAFDLCRELRRKGFDVQVVMSGAASEMVTPEAMEFASGEKVITKILRRK